MTAKSDERGEREKKKRNEWKKKRIRGKKKGKEERVVAGEGWGENIQKVSWSMFLIYSVKSNFIGINSITPFK